MEQFKIRIQKRIFQSETTGFGVFRVSGLPGGRSRTLVGELLDVHEGDTLEVSGEFARHPRFGEQFRVDSYLPLLPGDHEGMVAYIASRKIPGLGRKTAKKIVKAFAEETLQVLQGSPERLLAVKGIGHQLVEKIRTSFRDRRILRELTVRLSPFGIGTATILKILREFGDQAGLVLESDPYVLMDTIRGVGFRIADTIGRAYGISPEDPRRLRRGVDHILSQAESQNGDLHMERYTLLENGSRLLNTEVDRLAEILDQKIERGELVQEKIPETVIMSARNHQVETETARILHRMCGHAAPVQPPDPQPVFDELRLTLTSEQQEAVRTAVSHPVTVITGGPGTGKTTIIRAVIETFTRSGQKVRIAAPTGRAAKRIEEATGFPASTIHRLLKINPETGQFSHDERSPLLANAVIIDEFSMADIHLFHALLRALNPDALLIIIGDKNQLPSVGPGNVLRDLIQSDFFPTVSLSRNFRQTEDSGIVENAYRIHAGEPLELKPYRDDLDFVFVRVATPEQAISKVMGILEHLSGDYSPNSPEVQVLAPMYRGSAGIDILNAAIQEKFNPEPVCMNREQVRYKLNDKVMQLRNNYEKDVFNGEQGIVAEYNAEERKLVIDFEGRFTEYSAEEVDELTLSYAVSIHKAQGSEYDCVILLMLPRHAVMLNREIFYTAVTRSRKKLFLVSCEDAIYQAMARSTPNRRRTLLQQRLSDFFEAG